MERSDKRKNKLKITKQVLNNPLLSQREIAKKTWLGKTTVQEHLQNIKMTKDDRIIGLTDKDFELMLDIQLEKKRRLKEEKDQLNNNDIDKWENTATKRYSLFRWDATDKDWGLKNIENIEII